MPSDAIILRGAAENNLRRVDLDLPRGALIVFVGVSGSGKSSLAFDTLHQEARRRLAETLGSRTRGLLDPRARPRFDTLTGLPPTVAVGQDVGRSPGPRATVGTLTDLQALVSLLMLRDGVQRCPVCDAALRSMSADEILAGLLALPEGRRLIVLAPLVDQQKGGHGALLEGLQGEGFARVRIDGQLHRLDEAPVLDARRPHDIELVIDRIRTAPDREPRLAEAIRSALRYGRGRLLTLVDDAVETWAEVPWCGTCRASRPRPEPALLSFNAPKGACRRCGGLGTLPDADALVVDPQASLREGAVIGILDGSDRLGAGLFEALADALEVDLDTPWAELNAAQQRAILEGLPEPVRLRPAAEDPEGRYAVRFDGALAAVKGKERRGGHAACPDCDGSRLGPDARAFRLDGVGLAELASWPLTRLAPWLRDSPRSPTLAPAVEELDRRLDMLLRCGLGHLTMDRSGATLSPGELRRLRLAELAGAALSGVLYVLDEPTAGLSEAEVPPFAALLGELRDAGNTVLVVEHEPQLIAAADLCVEFGPGAGAEGGRVIFQGPPAALREADTPTGRWLSGQEAPEPSPPRQPTRWLRLLGARGHNLQGVDAAFPMGALTAVTGPGGAGKSSLVLDTLHRALTGQRLPPPLPFDRLEGAEAVARVVLVEPRGVGGGGRSLVASYAGAWPLIRELYARTKEAKLAGFTAGHFSLTSRGGRCEACRGSGTQAVELGFLPDVVVPCPVCEGRRFDRATLRVRYRGLDLAELLALPITQARRQLSGHRRLDGVLRLLEDVGLGYVPLGQPTGTLSGGESQRLRLARDLAGGATDLAGSVYILDEPCVGLHPRDVAGLLRLLHRLADEGATIIAIAHNPVFIEHTDVRIALGPGAGEAGGRIV
ncbi:MAG: excinuclease ABC subunit UvrA [Alphaproteobacteria bacterium]|nr:excinuclease ABC subunit UvrA [Alphaproteobacteria bacterium]